MRRWLAMIIPRIDNLKTIEFIIKLVHNFPINQFDKWRKFVSIVFVPPGDWADKREGNDNIKVFALFLLPSNPPSVHHYGASMPLTL